MSYDVQLEQDGQTVVLDATHCLYGGIVAIDPETRQMVGTRHAELNITCNYAPHFYRTLGEKGIRTIYGMTAQDSISLLEAAAAQLGTDRDDEYWKPTEGNARKALEDLIALAKLAPPLSVWAGD